MYNPPHPGEILRDALDGLGMTIGAFAAHIGMSRSAVQRVLSLKAGISAEMSMRLGEAFGQNQPDLWLLMQMDYDVWRASQAKRKPVKPLKIAA